MSIQDTVQQSASEPSRIEEQLDVSVVIPAYNEAETIVETVRRTFASLEKIVDRYEVVVVDDGSTDETRQAVQVLSSLDDHLRVIWNTKNMGKGGAVKRAAPYVRGAAVVIVDADMEISPEQLQQCVLILKECDLCIMSKRHPSSVYDAPPVRKFLSVAFNKVVRLLTGIKYADSQTGLKALKGDHFRRIMNVISVKRYAYDVEVLVIAQLMNSRIAELPVVIRQRGSFSSKAILFMFIDLLGISYRLRVRKWYQRNLNGNNSVYKPLLGL